ncbi:MAG TPA: hypothetical protein VK188_05150, partial [Holophaga sp.]|nr:hypothetical protein [Holophaga sp.]
MNCAQARDLLGEPLHAASGALREHLAACPACAREAEALRELRAWLRADEPPFGEEDRRALRRGVMARIQAGRPWRRIPYLLALPLAAALLLALSLRRRPEEPPPAPPAPAVHPTEPPPPARAQA